MYSLLVILSLLAGAQGPARHGIPDDVYYLMPSFSQGMIYFNGQLPAQGQLNICAVDNSLRYLDKNGQELSAANADNIVKVQIDTAMFLRYQDEFYRIYPVTASVGVAVKREVNILKKVTQGGYGTTSQTSSTREYHTIYADGAIYNLNEGKDIPYEVSEIIFIYKGNEVFPLTKKNLRKLFPASKDAIDACFKAGNPLPADVPSALALLSAWAK